MVCIEFVSQKLDVINLDKLLDVAFARSKGWASSSFKISDNAIYYRINTNLKTLQEFIKLLQSYGKLLYLDIP